MNTLTHSHQKIWSRVFYMLKPQSMLCYEVNKTPYQMMTYEWPLPCNQHPAGLPVGILSSKACLSSPQSPSFASTQWFIGLQQPTHSTHFLQCAKTGHVNTVSIFFLFLELLRFFSDEAHTNKGRSCTGRLYSVVRIERRTVLLWDVRANHHAAPINNIIYTA